MPCGMCICNHGCSLGPKLPTMQECGHSPLFCCCFQVSQTCFLCVFCCCHYCRSCCCSLTFLSAQCAQTHRPSLWACALMGQSVSCPLSAPIWQEEPIPSTWQVLFLKTLIPVFHLEMKANNCWFMTAPPPFFDSQFKGKKEKKRMTDRRCSWPNLLSWIQPPCSKYHNSLSADQ